MEGEVLDLYNKAVAAYDRGSYEIAIQEYEKAGPAQRGPR